MYEVVWEMLELVRESRKRADLPPSSESKDGAARDAESYRSGSGETSRPSGWTGNAKK